jgi:plasmid stabilization system protein ParE
VTVPLVWHPAAVDEFLGAVTWYEQQRPTLGAEFADACRAALALIQDRPQAFRIMRGDVRRVLLRRFPYAIFYRYREAELLVVAVMHERRDPRRWQDRR